ncbi:MAG: lipase family protein [Eubacteriaceae bacterium]|nr:lipase family protein [Eubacteriaceae bacterium]
MGKKKNSIAILPLVLAIVYIAASSAFALSDLPNTAQRILLPGVEAVRHLSGLGIFSQEPQESSQILGAEAPSGPSGFDEDKVRSAYRYSGSGATWQQPSQYIAGKQLRYAEACNNSSYGAFFDDGWGEVVLIEGSQAVDRLTSAQQEPSALNSGNRAAIATRLLSDGTPLICIAFSATENLTDWMSNLSLSLDSNMHSGFLALAKDFHSGIDAMKLTGLSQLTNDGRVSLGDYMQPNSNALFWITGHSQGGAVTQAFVGECLKNRADLYEKTICYTFGSPTVASRNYASNPTAYPIYNIVNTDDPITKVGSEVRLGFDLVYDPSEQFREENYNEKPGVYEAYQGSQAFRDAVDVSRQIRTSSDAIAFMIAHSNCALLEALRSRSETQSPLRERLLAPINRAENVLSAVAPNAASGARELVGRLAAPLQRVSDIETEIGQALPVFEGAIEPSEASSLISSEFPLFVDSIQNIESKTAEYTELITDRFGVGRPGAVNAAMAMVLGESHKTSVYNAIIANEWAKLRLATFTNGNSSDEMYRSGS